MHPVEGVVLAECEAIASALNLIDGDAAFSAESNCPPWTLKELVVHTWQTILLPRAFRTAGDGQPKTAADWYRRSERETPEYRTRNVDQARAAAAAFTTGAEALTALVAAAGQFEDRIAHENLRGLIATPSVSPIALHDYVVTRVVSVAVHGLDIAISIGAEPFTTRAALDLTCGVLEELLRTSRAKLGWTEHELLAWGTGRTTPAADRAPSQIVDRLPLIS